MTATLSSKDRRTGRRNAAILPAYLLLGLLGLLALLGYVAVHRWALLAGWAAGMIYGTVTAYGGWTQCTLRPFPNSVAKVPLLGEVGTSA